MLLCLLRNCQAGSGRGQLGRLKKPQARQTAKKTRVAASSEEDDKSDTGMDDCSIRVITASIANMLSLYISPIGGLSGMNGRRGALN